MSDTSETTQEFISEDLQLIGQYRLVRLLGEGGFGRVYLALDEQLDRPVAIKIPHARLISEVKDADAYLAEARTVASLDHPYIVPVYHVGRTETVPCYLVSKYIEGTNLATRLKESQPTTLESVELAATIAEALHHAHSGGVIHRDIKPANILLDLNYRPFLTDFGLALREQRNATSQRHAGTPAYMSPEQARGEGHRVDGRSDVFSLGVVLYECLTGQRPFHAETRQELFAQIAAADPPSLCRINRALPKELERVCLKALSKRVSDRYATAKEFAEDLRHFLSTPPPESGSSAWSQSALLETAGSMSQRLGLGENRSKVYRSTFVFVDFKGYTERVRILENTAGPQAAAEMKRKVAEYIEEAFKQVDVHSRPDDYHLIDTAGDGFFLHFKQPGDVFHFAEILQKITSAHNARVSDEIAEHWFRIGAATGEAAWYGGKPVGHVVNVSSRLQGASTGGDLVVDQATFDALSPAVQQQFGPREAIRDKHGKEYSVHRTGFGKPLAPLVAVEPLATPTVVSNASSSDQRPLKIVPKGLRSFDGRDANFFLELLPGPRDRDDLPDIVRFWKSRLEEADADSTFAVGLIYGPSGCGKSSLMKAGVLPRLAPNILPIYLEATADETEAALLGRLRKYAPAVTSDFGLRDALSELRRKPELSGGKKIVIVIDQFEQWLHANSEKLESELVDALRQCDGSRLQCIVMVRDDFWMAATRFMRELEIRLLEGQNSAAVDLFPISHAVKVLTAFGRAFGALPAVGSDLTHEQKTFLQQAVDGLAQEGKVICVRLALFAEMMKNRPWNPKTLRDVGGAEGIGVAFLEETFASKSAPIEHRCHQVAAREVLKRLLPDSGSQLKGHMRTRDDLLAASGYGNRPADFRELIRILDSDLRLITTTESTAVDFDSSSSSASRTGGSGSGRYYQLSHDYLVPALRDWLSRKQRETRRGRAQFLLSDRANLWAIKPEPRLLPTAPEFARIVTLTRPRDWTTGEKQMMDAALRVHSWRFGAFLIVAALLAIIGLQVRRHYRDEKNQQIASHLVDQLRVSEIDHVPKIAADLNVFGALATPLLQAIIDSPTSTPTAKLNAILALGADNDQRANLLLDRLLLGDPKELAVLRDSLLRRKDLAANRLWSVATDSTSADARFLAAAAALATYAPDDPRWDSLATRVVDKLVNVSPVEVDPWKNALRPVRQSLIAPLESIYAEVGTDALRTRRRHELTAYLLADYASSNPDMLADLTMAADAGQFPIIFPKLKQHRSQAVRSLVRTLPLKMSWDAPSPENEHLGKRQSNAAIALLHFGEGAEVWPLLALSEDRRTRSYIVRRANRLGVPAATLLQLLNARGDVSIRSALLLALGDYDPTQLPVVDRDELVKELQATFDVEPDAAAHGAAAWLLRKWGHDEFVVGAIEKLANKPAAAKQWFVNGQNQTMFAATGADHFLMGSPANEVDREGGRSGTMEQQHTVQIPPFAISAHKVTLEEFLRFRPTHAYQEQHASPAGKLDLHCPVTAIAWEDAAAYCNWLSEQEGLPAEQWCYDVEMQADGKTVVRPRENFVKLTGYRLPTEPEWEFACRAGARTSRFFGETAELLDYYAWNTSNSQDRGLLPVGSLKPNDFGLFDIYGNVAEWCELALTAGTAPSTSSSTIAGGRVLRGGSFYNRTAYLRSAYRLEPAVVRSLYFGFRVAKSAPAAR